MGWSFRSKSSSSRWSQPIWKIIVKLDHLPRIRGGNKKSLSCNQLLDPKSSCMSTPPFLLVFHPQVAKLVQLNISCWAIIRAWSDPKKKLPRYLGCDVWWLRPRLVLIRCLPKPYELSMEIQDFNVTSYKNICEHKKHVIITNMICLLTIYPSASG